MSNFKLYLEKAQGENIDFNQIVSVNENFKSYLQNIFYEKKLGNANFDYLKKNIEQLLIDLYFLPETKKLRIVLNKSSVFFGEYPLPENKEKPLLVDGVKKTYAELTADRQANKGNNSLENSKSKITVTIPKQILVDNLKIFFQNIFKMKINISGIDSDVVFDNQKIELKIESIIEHGTGQNSQDIKNVSYDDEMTYNIKIILNK